MLCESDGENLTVIDLLLYICRDFQCLCEVGFEGKRCEREIDYCIDNRCEHGMCEQDRTGYRYVIVCLHSPSSR